jgi:hypothetical protein
MLKKSLIANAILVAALISDAMVHHRTKAKHIELYDDNVELSYALLQANARIRYLATMIDMHDDIDVDDFDLIILNDPTV